MLYTILCYNDEKAVGAWSPDQDAQVMDRLQAVQAKLAEEGRLGPVARLLPTAHAVTLRKSSDGPLLIDGPFAETKEQLLGFYLVDCASMEEATEIAGKLAVANGSGGSYEIRPVMAYFPPADAAE